MPARASIRDETLEDRRLARSRDAVDRRGVGRASKHVFILGYNFWGKLLFDSSCVRSRARGWNDDRLRFELFDETRHARSVVVGELVVRLLEPSQTRRREGHRADHGERHDGAADATQTLLGVLIARR